jgi:Flp pilus assembly protein TadB
VFFFIREPVLMQEMLAHPMGKGMLAAALVLEILGIVAFNKLIKVHI